MGTQYVNISKVCSCKTNVYVVGIDYVSIEFTFAIGVQAGTFMS